MVVEDFQSFAEWFLPGPHGWGFLAQFVLLSLVLAALGIAFSYVVAAVRHGFGEGFYHVARTIAAACSDALRVSPRRIWAMARLAIQESIRRRVLVAFAIFVLVLLFAGWFLDVKSDHPARLYLSFVLTATNYLVLMMALFLSTLSLPNDIKHRTIYTIVTKPVRPGEIILGRILGFGAIGTALLAVMCLISYVFVVRGLAHEHTVTAEDLTAVAISSPGQGGGERGATSFNAHHRHEFTIGPDGHGRTDVQRGHWHSVQRVGEGDDVRYEFGPPEGLLQARVPSYGRLQFIDRTGNPGQGVNVGHEWTYRSYIEGGTLAAAVWTFEDVTPERFPEGLPLELDIRVFRTHKGNIERRVAGSLFLKNPHPAKNVQSTPIIFESEEFSTQEMLVPRSLKVESRDGTLQDVDLFEALVDENGRVEVWLQCVDPGQYFGMAQADVYLRAADASFFLNFVKGYTSIWLQMVVVTCFGVMFSTFLSGAVALMSTLSSITVGYFGKFIADVASGSIEGGGPIESLIRILTQQNVSVDLEMPALALQLITLVDRGLMGIMHAAAAVLPDYQKFSTASYVAYGFNIQAGVLAQHVLLTAAYALVITIIAYFFLKTREIAA